MKKRDFRKLLKETKDLLTSIDYVFAIKLFNTQHENIS